MKAEEGPEIVLERKAGAFKFDIEVQGGRNDEECQMPRRTAKPRNNREMDVDEAGIEKSYYDALWEDSLGLADKMTGMIEEEMQCQVCQPAHYGCGHICNDRSHRRSGPTEMQKIALDRRNS